MVENLFFVRFCAKASYISKFNCTTLKHYFVHRSDSVFRFKWESVLQCFAVILGPRCTSKYCPSCSLKNDFGEVSGNYRKTKCLQQLELTCPCFLCTDSFQQKSENCLLRTMITALTETASVEKNAYLHEHMLELTGRSSQSFCVWPTICAIPKGPGSLAHGKVVKTEGLLLSFSHICLSL